MKTITCPHCDEVINTTIRKKELKAIRPEKVNLHGLIGSIYDVQEMRLRFEARFTATQQNEYGKYAERIMTLENAMKDAAEAQTKLYPIHEWIIAQKGLSYDIAGQLIGVIQDIDKFTNISKLWAYFGLAVVDVCQNKGCGKRWYPVNEKPMRILHVVERLKEQNNKKIVKTHKQESDFIEEAKVNFCSCQNPQIKKTSQRLIKGCLTDYNPQAKKLAYKIGVQFVKQGDLYRNLYEQFKAEYMLREDLRNEIDSKKGKKVKAKNGEVTESKGTLHIHNMAQRKVVKIFLQHLWVQWRTIEHLSVSEPYVIARLGHCDYIPAQKSI